MVATKKLFIYIGVPLAALVLVVSTASVLVFYYKDPEAATVNSRKKLVIDHDGGADDALAITMSLLNEKYFGGPNLVALTATYGNVNLSQAIINSDRILALCNRQDIPIYEGAERSLISGIESDCYYGYDGLGDDGYLSDGPIDIRKEPAAYALLKLSKQYEGNLIVIAIGPLTNIALAIRMDPKFIDRIAHLYIGAGHIYSEKYSKPEFNADMDPEAYHIVVDSASVDKVTVIPFSQVYKTLNITKDWRRNVLGSIQTPTIQALNCFERKSLATSPSWIQLDPAVAAVALADIGEDYRNSANDIILHGEKRGINTNDFTASNPNVRLLHSANEECYKKFLIDVYSAELCN